MPETPLPYSDPADAPVRFPMRFIVVMLVVPIVAVLLWLLLPDGWVSVACLFVAILSLVGGGIAYAMTRSHDLDKKPPRRPDTSDSDDSTATRGV